MSKHEVLTGVSSIGKTNKRLFAGDVLDSTQVTEDELAFFLARGAVGPALPGTAGKKTTKPQATTGEEGGD